MKPFHFALESLLRLRKAERDLRRAELARLLSKHQLLKAAAQAAELRLSEHRERDRRLRQSAAFSPEALRQSESCRQTLAAEQARAAAAVDLAADQVEDCQQQLAATESAYQAVAKLRESRLFEYQRSCLREEAKLADEAAHRTLGRAT